MKNTALLFTFLLLIFNSAFAQNTFTHQDTLRGAITKERAWWDITYYHLSVDVNTRKKTITGSNLIQYKVLTPHQTLQVELQEPLKIFKVIQNEKELSVRKDGYSYFIELQDSQTVESINELTIYYKGEPQESENPPWNGGLTWKKDRNEMFALNQIW